MTGPRWLRVPAAIPEDRVEAATAVARRAVVSTLGDWDLDAEVDVRWVDGAFEVVLDRSAGPPPAATGGDSDTADGALAGKVLATVGPFVPDLVTAVAVEAWWVLLQEDGGAADDPPPWFADVVREMVDLGEGFDRAAWADTLHGPDADLDPRLLVELLRAQAGQPVRIAANARTLAELVDGIGRVEPDPPWDALLVEHLGVLGVLTPTVTFGVHPGLPDREVQVCLGRLPLGMLSVPADAEPGSLADDFAHDVAWILASVPGRLPNAVGVENLLSELSEHVGSGHTVWFTQGVLATEQIVHVVRRQLAEGHQLAMLPTLLREVLSRLSLLDEKEVGVLSALDGALERLRQSASSVAVP